MGMTAELVADKYKISREEQDQFALESHRKAVHAMNSCFINRRILPLEVPQKKGDPVVVQRDESPREDTSLEALASSAGVQERRHRDRRQRSGHQRRRRRRGR